MKHFLYVVLVLFALGMFTGCGQQDDRVRVRIWHQKIGAEREFFERLLKEYNAQQTDHYIEALYRETEELRNIYVVAAVGGQGPDLIFGPADNVGILALTETIMPIDRVLPDSFLAQFSQDGIVEWDGQRWLIADQVGNHLAYVYNEDLIANPPATTDEMIQVLQRVTEDINGDGTPDRYGLTWNYREPFFFIPFLTGFGGWVMDEEGNPTLNTEATVKAIRFILDLRDRYKVIPAESDYDVSEALFKEERSASIINGPWAWAGYGSAGVDYRLARIPKMSATGLWCAPMTSAKGYSVNVNVPEEKLPYIRQVLTYLAGPEVQARMAAELATIPVITTVRNSEAVQNNPVLQASLRQVEVGRPMPIAPQMRQLWDGMRGPYQLVMNGAVTPEQGAALMQQEVEKRIADTFL